MNLCRSKTLLLLVVITALAFANPASAQQGAGGPAHEWGYFGDGQREEALRIFLRALFFAEIRLARSMIPSTPSGDSTSRRGLRKDEYGIRYFGFNSCRNSNCSGQSGGRSSLIRRGDFSGQFLAPDPTKIL